MRGGVAGVLVDALVRRRSASGERRADATPAPAVSTRRGVDPGIGRPGRLSLVAVGAAFSLAGCDPIIDVQGAFFPAWIVCILAGLALTGLAHRALVALRIQEHVTPAVLVYPSMVVLFTMAVWLIVYRS